MTPALRFWGSAALASIARATASRQSPFTLASVAECPASAHSARSISSPSKRCAADGRVAPAPPVQA